MDYDFSLQAKAWAAGEHNELAAAAADIGVALETCLHRVSEVRTSIMKYSASHHSQNNGLVKAYEELLASIDKLNAALASFPNLVEFAKHMSSYASKVSPNELFKMLEQLRKERESLQLRMTYAESAVASFDAAMQSANSSHQIERKRLEADKADETLRDIKEEMLGNQQREALLFKQHAESSSMMNLQSLVKGLAEDIEEARKLCAKLVSELQSRKDVVALVNKLYNLLFVSDGSRLA